MKRKQAVALLLAGTLLTSGAALASEAGSAGDPLISLNWIKNTFLPSALEQASQRVDSATEETYRQVLSAQAGGTELRLKRGDVLRLETGSGVLSLAGGLSGSASGTVVDVTDGTELAPGGPLTPRHRYLAAENTTAAFSVSTDTAVVRLTGRYTLSLSGETDYNALADALKIMGLFRGSDTPYGSGYELENAPTRIQGLILFLRLLGEEQAALSYPGSGVTFADVPTWAKPYVAYAYDKGYTKGMAVDSQWRVWFGTENALAPNDYVTFLLRALGYSEAGGDFSWLTAARDARALGVLTAGEETLLTGGRPFLRAQVAYLSYYALGASVRGGETTLLDRLTASGAVNAAVAQTAIKAVAVQRL
ncbi:MAG: hypothetical protein MR272_05775 [Pseudoflavonifractor sp.]|nr:hypothetical protein [Pseudoflavonifractor sp.]MDY3018597.1 hypothetical protein [Oscillospiraceae bacterium]